MNRRDFIKIAVPSTALATWTVNCKYEEKEHDPKGEKGETGATGRNWNYRVYCYERQQGEWTFSNNIKGSFAPQREYATFKEEDGLKYCGWMDQGKLHFDEFDNAVTFIDCHVRTKDDTDLIDSIYDIYFVSRKDPEREVEIKVAHYWYNGDTGRTVMWEQDGFNHNTGDGLTNWAKAECS
jgi:hypothetical protein